MQYVKKNIYISDSVKNKESYENMLYSKNENNLSTHISNMGPSAISASRRPAGEVNSQSRTQDLFCKIVAGDKSDNIPSVLPRCGMKTAAKFYENEELFQDRINITDGARERYERNKLIIDFDRIPLELINDFKITNLTVKK